MRHNSQVDKEILIGSPYGLSDPDWDYIKGERNRIRQLKVVFGYQLRSPNYNAKRLVQNIKQDFEEALGIYNGKSGRPAVTLDFKPIAAGYGKHPFSKIAREVMSADIAVFETSDFNPNVMMEFGVALTRGIHILPIKEKDKPKPPSDISGQTWANYDDSAAKFLEKDYLQKLVDMIEVAIHKKTDVALQSQPLLSAYPSKSKEESDIEIRMRREVERYDSWLKEEAKKHVREIGRIKDDFARRSVFNGKALHDKIDQENQTFQRRVSLKIKEINRKFEDLEKKFKKQHPHEELEIPILEIPKEISPSSQFGMVKGYR